MLKIILWRIKEYLWFLVHKNSHFFIHSPFVFKLSQEVLLNKNKIKAPQEIIEARRILSENPRTVEFYDYGAKAAHKGEKKVLTIGEIVRTMAISHKTGSLLFRLCRFLQPKKLLELGTNIGLSTMYQVKALREYEEFTTVEANESLIFIAKQLLRKHKINFVNALFDDYLQQIPAGKKYDYILIDGNHSYEATKKYVRILKNNIEKDGIIIIADIRWSPQMKKAFYELIEDEDFTLTIDLFDTGLLFYKRNQYKEHFILSYK